MARSEGGHQISDAAPVKSMRRVCIPLPPNTAPSKMPPRPPAALAAYRGALVGPSVPVGGVRLPGWPLPNLPNLPNLWSVFVVIGSLDADAAATAVANATASMAAVAVAIATGGPIGRRHDIHECQ